MTDWLYVAACVLVPALWGFVAYLLFDAWDRRLKRSLPDERPPPIDYSI